MRGGTLRVCSLTHKLLSYGPSLELQEKLVQHRKAGAVEDTLLIVQHSPVFTIGKRGSAQDFRTNREELSRLGIDVFNIPRGGETTYHGPGQLVAYPIINLRQLGLGARAYVQALERVMVLTAGCYGIQARGQVPGKTGVWVGDRKIGAVGVRITHGISSHGIAFNVCTDLGLYRHIVPCGTPDKEVTSVQQELARPLGANLGSNKDWRGSSGASYQDGQKQPSFRQQSIELSVAEQHLLQSFLRVLPFGEVTVVDADAVLGA